MGTSDWCGQEPSCNGRRVMRISHTPKAAILRVNTEAMEALTLMAKSRGALQELAQKEQVAPSKMAKQVIRYLDGKGVNPFPIAIKSPGSKAEEPWQKWAM